MLGGRRVLVTGATGFIGSALCRRLLADGTLVSGLGRTPGKGDALAREGVHIERGDVTDRTRMAELVKEAEVVIHAAALLRPGSWTDFERINASATRDLAQVSADAGVERLVFISSVMVYGAIGQQEVDESRPLKRYGDYYGDSKILAEQAMRTVAAETGLNFCIARPGMVYGPGSRTWTVWLYQLAKQGRAPLVGGGRGTCCPIYVSDLVDGLVRCAALPEASGETFNFVNDGPTTWREFLGGYMRMAGTERALRVPGWLVGALAALADPLRPGDSLRMLADHLCGSGQVSNRHALEALGWRQTVSLEEGMRRCQAWLGEAGLL
jgi:nucleoside-diphosphate-sugar epimerase